MTVKVGILGAGGRMGHALLAELPHTPGLSLAGAIERAGHAQIGQPLGPAFPASCTLGSNPGPLARAADVLIDFTSPMALEATLDAACEGKAAVVIGTTGLEAAHHALIDAAARSIPILQAANTSLGVTLLTALVEQAARALGEDWDIEILDMHHRHKVDAPSGTALALGEAAARGRGIDLAANTESGRHGVGPPRSPGAIGFAALRGGSVAGDHSVIFAQEGERLELSHRAESRIIFARGALRAALWLAGKPKGRYTMDDVLGLPAR
ncbi:MAG: 4-hydroxy-tetrahydrodipicolinate reductase [Polymorphobacter sp.]|uniref:4-hydroxy-tetrahydrodipicolinate reductase n=1 Tax=Polymorphobacter sp. TaxID=1909290 RepID=UPI003A8A1DF0